VRGIVLEVQLSHDGHKSFVWPSYVANLRARLRLEVCLLVVAADEAQAQTDPELTVLSAIAHGRDEDAGEAARIGSAAQTVGRANPGVGRGLRRAGSGRR